MKTTKQIAYTFFTVCGIVLTQPQFAQLGQLVKAVDNAKTKNVEVAQEGLSPDEEKLLKKLKLKETEGVTGTIHQANMNKIVFTLPEQNRIENANTKVITECVLGEPLGFKICLDNSQANYAAMMHPKRYKEYGNVWSSLNIEYFIDGQKITGRGSIKATELNTNGQEYSYDKSTTFNAKVYDKNTNTYPTIATKDFETIIKKTNETWNVGETVTLKIVCKLYVSETDKSAQKVIAEGEIKIKKTKPFDENGKPIIEVKTKEFDLSSSGIAATITLPENSTIVNKGKDEFGDQEVLVKLKNIDLMIKEETYSGQPLNKIIASQKASSLKTYQKLVKEDNSYFLCSSNVGGEEVYFFMVYVPLNAKKYLSIIQDIDLTDDSDRETTIKDIEAAINSAKTLKAKSQSTTTAK